MLESLHSRSAGGVILVVGRVHYIDIGEREDVLTADPERLDGPILAEGGDDLVFAAVQSSRSATARCLIRPPFCPSNRRTRSSLLSNSGWRLATLPRYHAISTGIAGTTATRITLLGPVSVGVARITTVRIGLPGFVVCSVTGVS